MSISEIDCGMTKEHIKAVQEQMILENTFLFVRPTEYDSTVLIKAGFATKSMDIHDKSSNWGPMAGMVPCDPAFSKKLIGTPNNKPEYNKHEEAYPIQLKLPRALFLDFLRRKIDEVNGYQLMKDGSVIKGKKTSLQVKFCKAKGGHKNGNKSTLFCLKAIGAEWEVFWVKWSSSKPKNKIGKLVPIIVWAYEIKGEKKPVTGDYDLWMVAPFWNKLKSHCIINIESDIHGKSAATEYITKLISRMNKACKRSDNEVFRHGAESQNYGFTQSLDKRIAMFTPSGKAFPVSIQVMPKILSEIQNAGYLVYWNKRYGEIDPKLSGKNFMQRKESRARALKALYAYEKELKALKMQGISTATGAEAVRARAAAGQKGVGAARFRHAVRQVIARGDQDIRKFNNELEKLMREEVKPLKVLMESDFPANYQQFRGDARRMLQDIQKGVVSATATTGTGQTDITKLSKVVSDWLVKWKKYYGES